MKTLIAVLAAVAALGSMAAVHAYDIENSWTGFYHNDGNEGQAWLFNPNSHEITHVDPDQEFTVEHIGSWDVITHSEPWRTDDYSVNGTTALLQNKDLPVLVWLDQQVNKIFKWLKLHDTQVAELQEENTVQQGKIDGLEADIDALESKIGKQAQRIKTLEGQMLALTQQPQNLPNLP